MAKQDDSLNRRDFIRSATVLIGGIIGTALTAPAIAYLISPASGTTEDNASIDLGPLDKYPAGVPTPREFTRTKINGWERTAMAYGVFVVRQSDTSARVFSNICTHLACHVAWHPDIQNYVSPCHDGHFDILGKNISGPPPRPLDEFVTKLEAGNLFLQLPPFKRTS
jgi:Rieske Fe-S protein